MLAFSACVPHRSVGFGLQSIRSRVGVHGVAARGREGGVQDGGDADDDHVAGGVYRLVPVRYYGVVAAGVESVTVAVVSVAGRLGPRLDQVVTAHSQVHLSGAKHTAVDAQTNGQYITISAASGGRNVGCSLIVKRRSLVVFAVRAHCVPAEPTGKEHGGFLPDQEGAKHIE